MDARLDMVECLFCVAAIRMPSGVYEIMMLPRVVVIARLHTRPVGLAFALIPQ